MKATNSGHRWPLLLATLVATLVAGASAPSRAASPTVETPYLGQDPPGLTPEVFAPGLVSTEHWEFGVAFTPDLDELYLLRAGGRYDEMTFVVFRHENGAWHESVVSPRAGQPFIAPDGRTLHLGRRFRERTPDGWSDVKSLGGAFEDIHIMRLTASARGTWVFDEVGTDGDGVIRVSRLIDGVREEPRPASDVINTGTWLAHPFIAPDESYILWDGRRDEGHGHSDIYVSFRQPDGSWGEAVNLGDDVNTDAWEASASVTPDGKYLFFHRNVGSDAYENVDVFWVDAGILEALRR